VEQVERLQSALGQAILVRVVRSALLLVVRQQTATQEALFQSLLAMAQAPPLAKVDWYRFLQVLVPHRQAAMYSFQLALGLQRLRVS
jgi:hypothetical protein